MRKHGVEMSRRRTWRKPHLCVDETSKDIVAVDLTTSEVHDGSHLPTLLDAIAGEVGQVSADTAYDSATCYEAILARGAVPTIPPRRNARFSNAKDPPVARAERDAVVHCIKERGDMPGERRAGRPGRALPRTPCRGSRPWLATRLRRESSGASRLRLW